MPIFNSCRGCIHAANQPNAEPCEECIRDVLNPHYVSLKQMAEEKRNAPRYLPLEEAVMLELHKPGCIDLIIASAVNVMRDEGSELSVRDTEYLANAFMFAILENLSPIVHAFDFPIIDFRRLRDRIAAVIRVAVERETQKVIH